MLYLRAYKAGLVECYETFGQDVLALEGALGLGVGKICLALARGQGEFYSSIMKMRGTVGQDLRISHIDLDDDVVDNLITSVGEEEASLAGEWVLKRLTGEAAIMIAWKIGRISVEGKSARMVCQDRVQFSFDTRAFYAVFSHSSWEAEGCKLFEVSGRKRTLLNLSAT